MMDRYAVIEDPVGHTKSPMIHLAFAGETGQDIDDVALEAPISGSAAKLDAFGQSGGLGLTMTTSACSSSRQPRRSRGGAAAAQTPGRSSKD
jgi:shikimate 5-dehydrogenase